MARIAVTDRIGYGITKREYTDEGFLMVPGRVARSGIQQYLASELGLTDRKPNDLVNVYRPPEEVFNADSLASYDASDVTIEHPSEMVNADTYSNVSAGVVRGNAVQDGDFVLANLIIKSKDGIAAVETGKAQLSAGYTALYDDTPGTTPDGQKYDFVQRDIKINHVALVDRARAGAQARLFDNHGVKKMTKIVLDSGRSIEIEDSATATLVQDSLERLTKQVKDAEEVAEKAKAKADMTEEELIAEKKKSSDSAIKDRVDAIARVNDSARKIAGKDFTCDSVDVLAIKRQALTVARDSVAWAEKSDAYVDAAFDMQMDADATDDKGAQDSYAKLATDAAAKPAEPVKSAYDTFKDEQADAWKGE